MQYSQHASIQRTIKEKAHNPLHLLRLAVCTTCGNECVRACIRVYDASSRSLPIAGFFPLHYVCACISPLLSGSRPPPPPPAPLVPPIPLYHATPSVAPLFAKACAPASHRGPFDRSCSATRLHFGVRNSVCIRRVGEWRPRQPVWRTWITLVAVQI